MKSFLKLALASRVDYNGDPDGDKIDNNDGVNGATGEEDLVHAGAGDVTVYGGDGRDTIFGDGGNIMVTTSENVPPFAQTCVSALLATALCLGAQSAAAQVQPDAGSLLRNNQDGAASSSTPQASDVAVNNQGANQAVAPGGAKILVNAVSIRGVSVFSEAALLTVLGHKAGARYDLAGLLGLGEAITNYYRQEGYPFAYAYLPAQKISDGTLIIEVLEGHYGSITTSGEEELAGPAEAYTRSLKVGDVIAQDRLARTVLVLGDVPGIAIEPVLRAGAQLGTGDLDIEVAKTRGWDASVTLDNHGNRYAGDIRGRINLGFNQLLTFGDRLSLSLLRSNKEMTLGEIGYGFALGGSGLRGNISASKYDYALSDSFVGFDGGSETLSATLSYPIIRSTKTNLTTSLGYQYAAFRDGLNGVSFDDKTSRVFSASLAFDHRDARFGGGLTSGSLALSSGDITSTSGAAVQGSFSKVAMDISRQQALSGGFSLMVRANAQISANPLNGSQQISLGGATGVRAYPTGEAAGTTGSYVQSELSYTRGIYSAFVFYDVGAIAAEGAAPARTLSGYGIGFGLTRGALQGSIAAALKGVGGAAQSDALQRDPQFLAELKYSF
jgi:hemolysin activation/secretion protein